MLDKSKFEQFSYLSSKWDIEQQRQLATSITHLAQELLMNVQCSGLTSFAKETRALKMRSGVASHRKLTITNWEDHQSWSSSQPHKKLLRAQCQLSVLWSLGIWSRLERWKARQVGASWVDKIKKKIIILKYHLLLLYATTMNHFSIGLWHVMRKWILCNNQWWSAQCLDQEDVPKHFPKTNLH